MSTPPPPSCPPLGDLDRLVQGALAGAEAQAITAHTERCAACTERLAELRANAELVPRLRDAARRGAGQAAADTPLVESLRAVGYDVVRELRRGGQGIVYVALQRSTDRRVAVKVLLSGHESSARHRLRFEREVDLSASLDHPNIVTIFDRGDLPGGGRFYAMELVDGRPLDVCAAELPALRDRLRLFARLCDAIRHAHQRGVIHRDLKPENVLVDARGEPRVLDFGLAKPTLPGTEATPTRSGEFVGTLAFASPEQVSGRPERVDVRTDVYALGVMLYRVLSGRHPHPTDGPLLDAVRHVTEGAPPPPSRHASGIDGDLDTICLRALSKDVERRYQSVDALQADILAWLSHRPIAARSDSGWYVLRKTLRRHRLPATALFVVLAALAGAVIVSRHSLSEAQLEARRARTANEFLIDTLTAVGPGREPVDTRVVDLMRRAAADVGTAFAGDPVRQAAIREELGHVLWALGLYSEGEDQLQAAWEQLRDHLAADHAWTTRVQIDLARLLTDMGRAAPAAELLDDAQRHAEHWARDDERWFELLRCRALLAMRRGELDDAETLLASAREHVDNGDPTSSERAQRDELLVDDAGALAGWREDHAAAEAAYGKLVELRRLHLGDDHPHTQMAMQRYAQAIMQRGRLDEAESQLQRAVANLSETAGEDSPLVVFARTGLTWIYMQQGRLPEAEELARELLAAASARHGPDHDRTIGARNNLAVVLQQTGAFEQAAVLQQEVLDARRAQLGHESKTAAIAALNLALAVGRLGRYEEAERLLRDAIAGFDRTLGPHARRTLLTTNVLGVLYVDNERWGEAAALYADLLARTDAPELAAQFERGAWRFNHGMALVGLGRAQQGVELVRHAHAELLRERGADDSVTRMAARVLERAGIDARDIDARDAAGASSP